MQIPLGEKLDQASNCLNQIDVFFKQLFLFEIIEHKMVTSYDDVREEQDSSGFESLLGRIHSDGCVNGEFRIPVLHEGSFQTGAAVGDMYQEGNGDRVTFHISVLVGPTTGE